MAFYIITMVTLGIFILIGLLIGLHRGLFLSLTRFIRFALAAVLSVPVSIFLGPIASNSLIEAIREGFEYSSDIPKTLDVIESVASAITAITVYAAVFLVFTLIFRIIEACFAHKITEFEKNREIKKSTSKILGLFIGMLGGIILFAALNMPLASALWAVGQINDAIPLSDLTTDESETEQTVMTIPAARVKNTATVSYSNTIDLSDSFNIGDLDITRYPVMKQMFNLIQKPLFEMTSEIEVNGSKTNLAEGISTTAEVIKAAEPLLNGSASSISEYSKVMSDVAEKLKDNALMSNLVSAVMSDAGTAWSEGKNFVGVEPILGSAEDNPIAKSIYEISAESTPDNVGNVLSSVNDIVTVMEKYEDTFKKIEEGDASEILLDTDMINDIVNEAKNNETSEKLLSSITDAVIKAVAKELATEGDDGSAKAEKIVDNAISALEESLKEDTKEKKKAKLLENIDKVLTECGIELDKDKSDKIINSIADSVVNYYGDTVPEEVKVYELLPVLSDALNAAGIVYENGEFILK